jgi:hypothetical protein
MCPNVAIQLLSRATSAVWDERTEKHPTNGNYREDNADLDKDHEKR